MFESTVVYGEILLFFRYKDYLIDCGIGFEVVNNSMATNSNKKNLLKIAVAMIGKHNIENNITKLRVAKSFANIGYPFVGFEGKDRGGEYFCLRVDYDEQKKGHINVTIKNESCEPPELQGETQQWYLDVINNINGGQYCGVPKGIDGMWRTEGLEQDQNCIDGMKRFMLRYV